MKFRLKHIYKYLTSKEYRSKTLAQRLDDERIKLYNERIKERSKHWAKVEQFYDGPMAWTEYTDHDGVVSRIYDLIPDPGFSHAYLDKKEDKDE